MANVSTDFGAIGLVIGAFKSARRDAIADLEYGGGMIPWRDGSAKRLDGRCLSLGTPSSERTKVEFGRLASVGLQDFGHLVEGVSIFFLGQCSTCV